MRSRRVHLTQGLSRLSSPISTAVAAPRVHVVGDPGHDLHRRLVPASPDPDRLAQVHDHEVAVVVDLGLRLEHLAQHVADEADQLGVCRSGTTASSLVAQPAGGST